MFDTRQKNAHTEGMKNITKQTVGENRTLIKITADNRKELIRHFYYYVNFGNSICFRPGTEIEDTTGLTFLNIAEDSAYTTVKTDEFIKTLQAIELFKLSKYTQNDAQISQKMRNRAQVLAKNIWNSIEETNIKDAGEIEIMLTEA